ncbi:FAD binding domain-containing protein [uncultured Sphingomonas sp.]|uniref:FAD binding domain-containing protein n=1 Tax=uncultured Sphingomonas sp. TaxID=158754 RepID=UPI0035CB7C9E
MSPFAYARPSTLAAAVASGARHRSDGQREPGADFFAGGTDMVQLMREHLRTPGEVLDITALPGLDRIEAGEAGLRIGALVRMSDAAAHPIVRERYAAASEALLASASAQVRNLATVGGNLLQRTRCGYFRDPGAPCNKRVPGSGCPAIAGQNRLHAVLGVSDQCIATYAGDFANALVALDAELLIAGEGGERRIPVAALHRPPGDTPWIETQLEPGELITAILLPARPDSWRSHYLKVRDRASFEWALASAAVALDLVDGVVRDARVAVAGVATTPWRLPGVETALRGRTISPAVAREAGALAGEGAVTHGRNVYKVELIRRTVARAIEECAA